MDSAASGKKTLADRYGRIARRLRISVTDRCNFRCVYCMPEEVTWIRKNEILSFEEMERLTRLFVDFGVDRVRLTGGEPLARRDLPALCARLTAVPGLREVTLTTNGQALDRHAKALWDAGLRRLNISLDTLDRERFVQIARRDFLGDVLRGIGAAEAAGFRPIKVNMVVMRGVNEDEVPAFARLARERGWDVRYIEFMPLDGDHTWNRDKVVPAAEIEQAVASVHPIVPKDNDPADPAREYGFADGRGSFGIIASVTRAFCSTCDRLRLTADGRFRTCLFATEELDLKTPLRAGAGDEELGRLIAEAVWMKKPGHLIGQREFVQPARAMYAIGG